MGATADALPDPPLLIITDRRQAGQKLEHVAKAAFDAGARWISVREKDLPWPEQAALRAKIAALAPSEAVIGLHGVPGKACSGVAAWHLPRDGDAAETKRRVEPGILVGKSCHHGPAVEAAAKSGADYVTFSPVFTSRSKPGYGPALGLEQLAAICRTASVPVIALGGIDTRNAADCLDAGAAGIAVMGDVMRADDPGGVIRDLLAAIGSVSNSR